VDENTIVAPGESTPPADGSPQPLTPPAGDATPDGGAAPDPAGEGTPPAAQGEEPPLTRAQKRIQRLSAEKKNAEQEAAYWKGVAEGRGGAAGTPAPAVDAPASAADLASPKVDDFENYDDYLVARAKHEIKIEQQQTTVRQAQTETQKAFAERLKKAAEDDPTVLDVYQDRNLPVSVPMAAVIMESEKGPEILKYLGNNREESARIARLTPIAAARELLRIESKIASTPVPPRVKVSGAPPPINPVTPAGSQSADLAKVPMEDFVKRRNAEQFGKRK